MPPVTSPLSLHDALPIFEHVQPGPAKPAGLQRGNERGLVDDRTARRVDEISRGLHQGKLGARSYRRRGDRKSTRLNSSHVSISYAVFCLKKKKNIKNDVP